MLTQSLAGLGLETAVRAEDNVVRAVLVGSGTHDH